MKQIKIVLFKFDFENLFITNINKIYRLKIPLYKYLFYQLNEQFIMCP